MRCRATAGFRGGAIAAAVLCGLASAIAPVSSAERAPPRPRVLVPQVLQSPPEAPSGGLTPARPLVQGRQSGDDQPQAGSRPGRSAPRRFGPPAPVQVDELGTLEGPVAGTLDDASGGLGADAWQGGADRAAVIALLQGLPASTPSAAFRLLLRKSLLTAAAPPPGRSDVSFNVARLTRLRDAGLIEDAADLALRIAAPANADIVRAQADAVLLAGRDDAACGDLTALRLMSAEPYWVKLRAYCYALAGDTATLDLTLAVINDQGLADPAYLSLLDGLTTKKPAAPAALHFPDALHIALLKRLKLPMTVEIAMRQSLSESRIAAESEETPAPLRIEAAERLLRAGALPTPLLARILDLSKFSRNELAAAPAMARSEPLVKGLARLKAALKASPQKDARIEIVHAAFEIGEREGVLAEVADLFGDDVAGIEPSGAWGNRAELLVRGLLLAHRADLAERWFDIIDANAPGMAETVEQLQIALAVAAGGARNEAGAELVLSKLAAAINPPLDQPDPSVAAAAAPRPEKPDPRLVARATLDFGILDALGRSLPREAVDASDKGLGSQSAAGRRPPDALMQRIARAALTPARGELALLVMTALGREGAGDLSPDIAVKLVRALQKAGISDAAEALALEAMALRPKAGAP